MWIQICAGKWHHYFVIQELPTQSSRWPAGWHHQSDDVILVTPAQPVEVCDRRIWIPQLTTDPLPNLSCWMMFEAAKHLPSLSTLFQAQSESALHMGERSPSSRPASSGVLSSSAVLGWKGPTKGRQALTPPSWTPIQTACTWIACWRSCCRALAVLLFLLAQKSRNKSCCWVDVLLRLCSVS